MKKTIKYVEKVQRKSAETAISGISGIFGRKKMLDSKVGLSHILGIAYTRFCAKNQEKQMMKSREKAQKPVFPAYFWHFRPENFFSKIGLRHILGIVILHFSAKNQKKTNEPISKKAGNERTDKHGLIYRTSG